MFRTYYLTNEHPELEGFGRCDRKPEFWCAYKAGRKGKKDN